jgi:hypothetical protein
MRIHQFFLTGSLLILIASCNELAPAGTTEVLVPNDTLVYDIYYGKRLAGQQLSWMDENGSYNYYYEYNDRGRGPSLQESISLNQQGVIINHAVSGLNYLKDSVSERFSVKNEMAMWENAFESNSKPFDNNGYYLSSESTFASMELLISKLLSEKSQSVDLLPVGQAKIVSITPLNVGDTLQVKLIGIGGLGFLPEYLWMDDKNRFFGLISPGWRSVLPKGFQSLVPTLDSIQTAVSENYLTEIAKELITIPKQGIAITHVAVFDVKAKAISKDQTVLIKGNKIESVTASLKVEIPNGYDVIDGSGKTLLPGLFDMHVHLKNQDGILNLASGVTSVRDMNNFKDLVALEKQYDSNELIGPRIVVKSKLIDGAGKYAGRTNMIMETLEDGLAYVQETKDAGYDQIKLYSSIKPEWIKPLAEKAHSLDLRVSGHIPAYTIAQKAVEDGYDGIQHINMLMLNFMTDTVATQTPLRLSMPADHPDAVDLNSKEFKDFVMLLKHENIVIDPTVSIFEGLYTAKQGEASPYLSPIINRLPILVQRQYYKGGLSRPAEKDQQYREAFEKMLAITNILYEAGVTIVPGTDALAGFTLHRELENYVKAGISEADVLTLATLGSAIVSKKEKSLGSIEAGKLADVILVNGNPLDNISAIRKVDITIKNGTIYEPSKLYEALGVKPYK